MGDRATAVLIPHQPHGDLVQPIYVMTHWRGTQLPQRVAQGLWDGRPRWGEPSYLTRVLLTRIMGDEYDTVDGYGIGLVPFGRPADGDRPALVVDMRVQRAGFLPWADVYAGRWSGLAYDYDGFIGEAFWPIDAKKPRPKAG